MEITQPLVDRILNTVDAGLTAGLGSPRPGKMCVEAAVCYALGLPHGGDPGCVGDAVRSYNITLNDAGWSSDTARAAGMRRLAVAQLGSDILDQAEFTIRLVLPVARVFMPPVLSNIGLAALAEGYRGIGDVIGAAVVDTACGLYNGVDDDLIIDSNAADVAYCAAYSAYVSIAAASQGAAAYASASASASIDADIPRMAASAAHNAAQVVHYAAEAARQFNSAAYIPGDHIGNAKTAADANSAANAVLTQAADLAVQVLTEMGSPGAAWVPA